MSDVPLPLSIVVTHDTGLIDWLRCMSWCHIRYSSRHKIGRNSYHIDCCQHENRHDLFSSEQHFFIVVSTKKYWMKMDFCHLVICGWDVWDDVTYSSRHEISRNSYHTIDCPARRKKGVIFYSSVVALCWWWYQNTKCTKVLDFIWSTTISYTYLRSINIQATMCTYARLCG